MSPSGRGDSTEAKLHQILDIMDVGLVHNSFDLRYLMVNAAYARLVGRPVDQIVGRSLADVLGERGLATIRPYVDRVLAGERVEYETELPISAERRRWIHVVYTPERDPAGQVVGWVGAITDITENRRTAERLAESERRLRLIIEHAPAALAVLDRDMRYLAASERWKRDYGLAEDIVGRSHYELFPEIPERWREVHRRALAGEVLRAEEDEFVRTDGSRQWLKWEVRPWLLADGSLGGILIAAEDVTARVLARKALEESARHFRFVTDHVPVLIVHCDAEARYRFANLPYTQRFGLRPEDVHGKRIVDVVGQAAYERLRPHVESALRGERVDYEELVPYAYGERWMHFIYEPQREADGAVSGFVAVIQDVTERRRAGEELAREQRRKDEFIAILAHELRNPLAPLRTGLELLTRMPANDPAGDDVRAMMSRQLKHMVRLIDDLLDVSRISRGKVELRRSRIDAAEAVRQGLESSRPLVQAKGHELSVKLPPQPLYVDADLTRIAQVVANVVNNAAKYTPTGGKITVTLERQGDDAVICVKDTGEGIAPEMLERVFEMFTQAGERGGTEAGLGIGLAIAKGLVDLHDGAMSASSAGRGKGSEFIVRLPLSEQAHPTRAAGELPAPMSAKRVLVVDDNADAAASLAALIRLSGSETRLAHDGEEAVAAARDFRPDVVLLDLGMPRMDGYEACRTIRACAGNDQPLIVALTGWGQEHNRSKAEEAGFDAHLLKPAEFTQIAEVISRGRVRH